MIRRTALASALVSAAALAVLIGGTAGGAINHPVPGIYGTITAGPTCPVERADQPCPPRPVAAKVKAVKHRRTIGSARSNSAGDYAMGLRPGTYTIVVDTGSTFPRCPTTTVTVPTGQNVKVDIACDTGIR